MKSTRKVIIAVVALSAAAGAGLWFAAGGKPATAEPPTRGPKKKVPLVEVAPVETAPIARTLELTGEVVATDSVVIAATKEGPISYCPWREGDRVEKGEKLIEIDRQVHRAEVQQAKAALEVARAKLADLKAGARAEEIDRAKANVQRWKATLQEAQTSYERQKELLAKDFTSRQAVDRAREKMEVAEAELAAAQETLRMLKAGPTATEIAVQEAAVNEAAGRLALAEAHLAECVITAPFHGTVTQVHVRPGDLATPRSPLIEMFDPDSLVVRFSVPEAHASDVRPGLAVEAELDALPTETFQGKVVRLYPQLDPGMHTRTVEAKLEGSERLMPHQFARMTLKWGSAENALIVPAEALRETPGGGKVAFVVKDGKAVRRTVQAGIQQGQRVQILQGIEAGERVVVSGGEGLKDGASVRVIGGGGKARQSVEAQKEGTLDGRDQKKGDAQ